MRLRDVMIGITFYPFDWFVWNIDVELNHSWVRIGPIAFDILLYYVEKDDENFY
jgi:hypothetical protein